MKENILLYTGFDDLKLYKRGKVRDVYDLGDELLIVSTDRISCFDVVLPSAIPFKGKVLTAISCFWFDLLKNLIPNHLITSDTNNYPEELKKYETLLNGRSMLVKKTTPLPVECIVRGYISGSAWKEYQKRQSVSNIALPKGLLESDKLPKPLFTPSTKADNGHDVNISCEELEKRLGKEITAKLKKITLSIYEKAAKYALDRGIIIADTKFEFGIYENEIIIIDEVLTPDSSRFWPKDEYLPGKTQSSFDKQFVRDYLESINWDKNAPAPVLPQEIIEKTSQKYLKAYEFLIGEKLIKRNLV